MTVYLDTSVVVPLFVDDDHSPRARDWARLGRTVALSAWTLAEFSSALSMQVRMNRLAPDERRDLEAAFDAWAGQGRLVDFDSEQFTQARRMLMNHDRLRAPDALHLAIAKANGLEMASLDAVLIDAALAEGLKVAEL